MSQKQGSSSKVEVFTGAASGDTINFASNPVKAFALQVVGTGAAAGDWEVRLEGSLDGSNWTQILKHTLSTGDGNTLFSGANRFPSRYTRTRCVSLTLGGATNIKAYALCLP